MAGKGKVVVVTGANTGIGYEVTRSLCEGGYDVVMACRSEEKTNRAIEKLKLKQPEASVTYMNLDLASLESVRKFVDDFHASGKKLNILINNAGLAQNFKDTKRQYTKDNFELTMGTNHLGHFLLTNLLLDDLKKVASSEDGEARIVVLSSSLHDPEVHKKRFGPVQPFDLENIFLFNEGTYNGFQAYKKFKNCKSYVCVRIESQAGGDECQSQRNLPRFRSND
jgi:light-dependent protochlorophyllide reductase